MYYCHLCWIDLFLPDIEAQIRSKGVKFNQKQKPSFDLKGQNEKVLSEVSMYYVVLQKYDKKKKKTELEGTQYENMRR